MDSLNENIHKVVLEFRLGAKARFHCFRKSCFQAKNTSRVRDFDRLERNNKTPLNHNHFERLQLHDIQVSTILSAFVLVVL